MLHPLRRRYHEDRNLGSRTYVSLSSRKICPVRTDDPGRSIPYHNRKLSKRRFSSPGSTDRAYFLSHQRLSRPSQRIVCAGCRAFDHRSWLQNSMVSCTPLLFAGDHCMDQQNPPSFRFPFFDRFYTILSCIKKRPEMPPAGKTVIRNFLGTGMVSVMPVLLLSVHPRE